MSSRSDWSAAAAAAWAPPARPSAPKQLKLTALDDAFADRIEKSLATPAEGNPTSDDSAIEVLDVTTGEQVASLAGKIQPDILAAHADTIGRWYNRASILCERNNHGHAVLLWLKYHSHLPRWPGSDGKEGWLSSGKGKALLYDDCAQAVREKKVVLNNRATFAQLDDEARGLEVIGAVSVSSRRSVIVDDEDVCQSRSFSFLGARPIGPAPRGPCGPGPSA